MKKSIKFILIAAVVIFVLWYVGMGLMTAFTGGHP